MARNPMSTWCRLTVVALIYILTVAKVKSVPVGESNNHTILNADDLFDGDLAIPQSMIRHYFYSGDADGNNTVSEKVRLWDNAIVPYDIAAGVPAKKRWMIELAIAHWEEKTCLKFVQRQHQVNYIKFIYKHPHLSYSDSIGKKGGEQVINIGDPCSRGTAIHEIGHAVGFWHEHSRPDRDRYIQLIKENLVEEFRGDKNFIKLENEKEMDYQGTTYDYKSVMHYSAFSGSNGCGPVFVPTNPDVEVDRDCIGQEDGLSPKDIQKANRLYCCPGDGVVGCLRIRVRFARNLPDTDPVLNDPDPYVKIVAVNSDGVKTEEQSTVKKGTENPKWNGKDGECIVVGMGEWQFFRIQIWDEDDNPDDCMSMSQTVVVKPGKHTWNRHCVDTSCKGYLWFDYELSLTCDKGPNSTLETLQPTPTPPPHIPTFRPSLGTLSTPMSQPNFPTVPQSPVTLPASTPQPNFPHIPPPSATLPTPICTCPSTTRLPSYSNTPTPLPTRSSTAMPCKKKLVLPGLWWITIQVPWIC